MATALVAGIDAVADALGSPSRLGDEEATLNELVAAKAAPMAPRGTPRAASAAQAKVERTGTAFDRVVAREGGAQGVTAGVAATFVVRVSGEGVVGCSVILSHELKTQRSCCTARTNSRKLSICGK